MPVISIVLDAITACIGIILLFTLDNALRSASESQRYSSYKKNLDDHLLYFKSKISPSNALLAEVARLDKDGDTVIYTLRDSATASHFFESRIPRLRKHFRNALIAIVIIAAGSALFGFFSLLSSDLDFEGNWHELILDVLLQKWYSIGGLVILISAIIGLIWEYSHFHREALKQLSWDEKTSD